MELPKKVLPGAALRPAEQRRFNSDIHALFSTTGV